MAGGIAVRQAGALTTGSNDIGRCNSSGVWPLTCCLLNIGS